MGELKGTVDEIIGDIVDTKAKAHFERIADAHPDFNEVGESEEFKMFSASRAGSRGLGSNHGCAPG